MKRIIYDYENPHIVGRAKNSFSLAKLIVAIIAISLAVALIYILFFKKSEPKHRYEAKEYYAVAVGEYSSQQEALGAANIIKDRGGGGYILSEGTFIVIVAVYKEKADAEVVAQRYGYKVISTGKYTADIPYEYYSLCALPEELFDTIYLLSVSLDKGEISSDAVQNALKRFILDINERKSQLKSNYSSDKLLDKIEQMYDLLIEAISISEQAVSSQLKYVLIDVTYIYKNFLISIS